jgi:hypothetical protein
MKQKLSIYLYGIFELLLGLAAVATGIHMLWDPNGLSGGFPPQYPSEWLNKVPFENWFLPGIIAILVFGLGNMIASIYCFRKQQKKSGISGIIMGSILLVSICTQMLILNTYLVSIQCLVLSIIQFSFGVYVLKAKWAIR